MNTPAQYADPNCTANRSHYVRAGRKVTKVDQHDFGVRDSKGRQLGARITYGTQEFAPGSEVTPGYSFEHKGQTFQVPERRAGCDMEPGTYFTWRGNATRNADPFGAMQSDHYCTTEAQRDTEVAKYLKGARRAAEKRAAVEAAKLAAKERA